MPPLAAAVGLLCGPAGAADEIHWTFTGPAAVTVDWRGTPEENALRYGTEPGNLAGLAVAAPPTPLPFSSAGPFWEARIGGLLEDTVYFYSIGNGPEHRFRTPPLRGGSGFVVFAEGDMGDAVTYPRMGLLQDLIGAEHPDFILAVGDLTYGNEHGQDAVDRHFNDVMAWSRDAAYMPAWGNHEWEDPEHDDPRNYKGRFDLPNPRTSPDAPAAGCCGEDWYWFDYGNVRFIAYPEPSSSGASWTEWATQARMLMTDAEADPDVDFIVTFGHRPAYSSGHHVGSSTLRDIMDDLGARYGKYVLNIAGHSHDYERTSPQNGIVHITVGTGGTGVGGDDAACRWTTCPPPSWSAWRAVRTGALRLAFSTAPDGKARIDGAFVCGPASLRDDVTCTAGQSLDTFSIEHGHTPQSAIGRIFRDLMFRIFGITANGRRAANRP